MTGLARKIYVVMNDEYRELQMAFLKEIDAEEYLGNYEEMAGNYFVDEVEVKGLDELRDRVLEEVASWYERTGHLLDKEKIARVIREDEIKRGDCS